MDPNHYHNRTPSPGRPLNGYQLEDNPYAPRQHLQMPNSSDILAEQPTVRSLHTEKKKILRR